MKILLIKPKPDSFQFGLAPFFQTEPLGLQYIAASLERAGHVVEIRDMRFERLPLRKILKNSSPALVGLTCLHILDATAVLRVAEEVKAYDPSIFVLAGGHAASAYPEALRDSPHIDSICIGEGEEAVRATVDALEKGNDPRSPSKSSLLDLAHVPVPSRKLVSRYQKNYCCLNFMPVWTLETSRGCSYRCKFCSVWQVYKGTTRFHKLEDVRADYEATGANLFIIDDLFWSNEDGSRELAKVLLNSKERKNWILTQSRLDLVANYPHLLEAWRPLAKHFDIFFGFEAATSERLKGLNKGCGVDVVSEALKIARRFGFGVTGNFIIDPDFEESDFHPLWSFLEEHKLHRVGFTILTPLPGTKYFDRVKDDLLVFDLAKYDLHHLLKRPKLPMEKFFELYCESWRRSVLNLKGQKKWWHWAKEVSPQKIPRLARILYRTQKLMDPKAYLSENVLPDTGRVQAAGEGTA